MLRILFTMCLQEVVRTKVAALLKNINLIYGLSIEEVAPAAQFYGSCHGLSI